MNHLTLGIYPNGEYRFNVVKDEDLQHHVEYNKALRGRVMYVDGKRVHNGCIKSEYLAKYDKIADAFYGNNDVDMAHLTIPYR